MTATAELNGFIAKYTPEIAKVAKAALPKMRALFPGTSELVYDNYNALVIAYSPTGKGGDAICSLALYPRWVTLFFAHGAALSDPTERLTGKGKGFRHVVLDSAATLDDKDIRALIRAAIAEFPIRATGKGKPKLVIQSISPKQRPRRPA